MDAFGRDLEVPMWAFWLALLCVDFTLWKFLMWAGPKVRRKLTAK